MRSTNAVGALQMVTTTYTRPLPTAAAPNGNFRFRIRYYARARFQNFPMATFPFDPSATRPLVTEYAVIDVFYKWRRKYFFRKKTKLIDHRN